MFELTKHFYNGFKKEELIHPEYANMTDKEMDSYIKNVCYPSLLVEQKTIVKVENNTMWYNTGRRIPILIAGYIFGSLVMGVIIIKIFYFLMSYK